MNQFLCCGRFLQDCWALPGGFVDEGEGLDTAAARELQEETSVNPSSVTLTQVWQGFHGVWAVLSGVHVSGARGGVEEVGGGGALSRPGCSPLRNASWLQACRMGGHAVWGGMGAL